MSIKTIALSELANINPALAKECVFVKHPQWTDWVSSDLVIYQCSGNNNGPIGWIKVVQG
jgi:hypothetical protein